MRIFRCYLALLLVMWTLALPTSVAAQGSSPFGQLLESIDQNLKQAFGKASSDDSSQPKVLKSFAEFSPEESSTFTASDLALRAQAAYKAGNDGRALLWYERLLILVPDQPETLQNLEFLNRKHGVLHAPHRLPSPLRFAIQHSALGCLIFATLAALLVLRFGYLKYVKYKDKALIWIGLLVIFIAISGAFYALNVKASSFYRDAMVVAPGTSLHVGASKFSTRISSLPLGSSVKPLSTVDAWTYVEWTPLHDEPKRGWLHSEQILPTWPYSMDLIRAQIFTK